MLKSGFLQFCDNPESATSQLISVLKGWKIESTEVMGVVDKLAAIDMNAAILQYISNEDVVKSMLDRLQQPSETEGTE